MVARGDVRSVYLKGLQASGPGVFSGQHVSPLSLSSSPLLTPSCGPTGLWTSATACFQAHIDVSPVLHSLSLHSVGAAWHPSDLCLQAPWAFGFLSYCAQTMLLFQVTGWRCLPSEASGWQMFLVEAQIGRFVLSLTPPLPVAPSPLSSSSFSFPYSSFSM